MPKIESSSAKRAAVDLQDEAPNQPPAKRHRAPLNFSIESIMRPIIKHNHNNNSPDPVNVSRSPSPSSDAGSTRSSGAESSASTLESHASIQKQQPAGYFSNGFFTSYGSGRHNNNSNHQHQQPQQASTSASSGPAGVGSNHASNTSSNIINNSTGHLDQVECVLDNKDMWDKFHSLNTEMIITKTGRRMFPVLKVQFHNLDPNARYAVAMDIVALDNKRYRYAYHKSCWQVAGKADPPPSNPRLYPHPDSPFNGDLLSRQVISFEKVKLTNNEMDKSGHIILNSMHKYQPRVHLMEIKPTLVNQPPTTQQQQINGKLNHSSSRYSSHHQQQANSCQPQQPPPAEGDYRTFVFPETVFTAVTAYQNQLITKMKIDKNPFAKGFRDSSRLSDLDRNDPFEGFMSLGPAAAAAAAAACAAGRFPGGPQGPGGGLGPGGLPPGSLEAAAVAAAGMQPGNQSQMDQAYAHLLASAAAANSPWYSAAAAVNASHFGSMGPSAAAAACSTAQAAQQLQATQMWLAAFSACLNNGAGGGGGPQLNQLPPPSGGPLLKHEPLESTGQMQECRGDSRSSG
uniref:T-box transcription factor TBX20 n=1 Tax=Aceria tosichella TaxID=561515 RepID=A0A6G1S9V6_9ACAR